MPGIRIRYINIILQKNRAASQFIWMIRNVVRKHQHPLKRLPDALKTEIQNGKYIRTEKELYDFLENYSSYENRS